MKDETCADQDCHRQKVPVMVAVEEYGAQLLLLLIRSYLPYEGIVESAQGDKIRDCGIYEQSSALHLPAPHLRRSSSIQDHKDACAEHSYVPVRDAVKRVIIKAVHARGYEHQKDEDRKKYPFLLLLQPLYKGYSEFLIAEDRHCTDDAGNDDDRIYDSEKSRIHVILRLRVLGKQISNQHEGSHCAHQNCRSSRCIFPYRTYAVSGFVCVPGSGSIAATLLILFLLRLLLA